MSPNRWFQCPMDYHASTSDFYTGSWWAILVVYTSAQLLDILKSVYKHNYLKSSQSPSLNEKDGNTQDDDNFNTKINIIHMLYIQI